MAKSRDLQARKRQPIIFETRWRLGSNAPEPNAEVSDLLRRLVLDA